MSGESLDACLALVVIARRLMAAGLVPVRDPGP